MTVEVSSGKIQKTLNLGRNKLVALALFLGSDFNTGVPSVGISTAIRALKDVADESVLDL